jgi:hypothetical protein
MAIRVYPPVHPVVNLRRKEAPRLAHSLAERVGGDNAVASHLLYGPMVDAKHAPDLARVDEVFEWLLNLSGPEIRYSHYVLLVWRPPHRGGQHLVILRCRCPENLLAAGSSHSLVKTQKCIDLPDFATVVTGTISR